MLHVVVRPAELLVGARFELCLPHLPTAAGTDLTPHFEKFERNGPRRLRRLDGHQVIETRQARHIVLEGDRSASIGEPGREP